MLAAFALNLAEPFLKMHVSQSQVRQFRGPATGRVKQLQQSAIPKMIELELSWRHQKAIDFLGSQHIWDSLPQLLTSQQFDFVVDKDPFQLKVSKVHFDGNDRPGDRSWSQFSGTQKRDKIRQLRYVQVRQMARPQPLVEPYNVPSVGHYGVVCKMALAA